jgi:flagellar hook-associated protein 1 FlgK
MASTFGTLGTALSALQYNRAGLDVASGNIANAGTVGYSRRVLIGQTAGTNGVAAMWSRSDQFGSGVKIGEVARTVDSLLDERSRIENGRLAELDIRGQLLGRVETALAEPGESGLQDKLSTMFNTFAVLGENPGDDAARQEVISATVSVAEQLHNIDRTVTTEWTLQRSALENTVSTINTAAEGVAKLNDAIRIATATGTDANDLLDQRDALLGKLGQLAGAGVTRQADGTVDVSIGGQLVVSGSDVTAVTVTPDIDSAGARTMTAASIAAVQVSVGGTTLDGADFTGTLGGQYDAIKTGLPALREKIDTVAQKIASEINAVYAGGNDADPFFVSNDGGPVTAATLAVRPELVDDPSQISADASTDSYDGEIAAAIGRLATTGTMVETYRSFVTEIGSDAAATNQTWLTQLALASSVDSSRMSIAGVDTDEEMVLLVSHQRAYEAAAKVMSTMDSVLDTLINRMGVG